jgi:hypothetical protein
MAGCAGSSPCSAPGKRERALPRLLLGPTRGGGPPSVGTARVGRNAFPTRLAPLRATLLAPDAAERTKRFSDGWIQLATGRHGP